MENKDNKVFLRHILDSIGKIERYLRGFDFEKFKQTEEKMTPLSETSKSSAKRQII
jgi:uncharacterized protein with HEPN domain